MSFLNKVFLPDDLRSFSEEDLPFLAEELRSELVRVVSRTGGHLGAGLGVIELSIALHYIFNTPEDKLIWDVGHQTYPHKILTGRRDRMHTLRQENGLSGFTSRAESIYDPFGAAHSSTSISAALGMAVARDLEQRKNKVIAVIGDGAMSAGMAYEAMNNAGSLHKRLIVILNDNDMSIATPTGAMSIYLARLTSGRAYEGLSNVGKKFATACFGKKASLSIERVVEHARGYITGGTLFEELGFHHIGPIDGHNFNHLIPVLKNVRDNNNGPVLIHVVTKKGKGYQHAEKAADKYHGVSKFDVITGAQVKTNTTLPSWTKVFSDHLVSCAKKDERIIGITAAMPSGTGLDQFEATFPERFFDVGIAEQHAVTFAAGLATEGFKPFVALYSTFLQRAYDQVVHDVAIQNLPVRFAIDRAGFVGEDGPTHCGAFDISFLSCLPNFVVMAPSDKHELEKMVDFAVAYEEGPIAFRYPRGESVELCVSEEKEYPLEIGKGRIIKEGKKVALISFGARLQECLRAAQELDSIGLSTTVADARFAKPLDEDMMIRLALSHEIIVTVEEGSVGGFGSHVLHLLSTSRILDKGIKIRTLVFPDVFVQQMKPNQMYSNAGLDAKGIVRMILAEFKDEKCSITG